MFPREGLRRKLTESNDYTFIRNPTLQKNYADIKQVIKKLINFETFQIC